MRTNQSESNSVLVISTMRDEAPYILEWISHYCSIGASHFLIFTNDCFDNTNDILSALSKAGLVTLVKNDEPGKQTPHWRALNIASGHPLLKKHDWALVVDADEFLNIHIRDGSLVDFIAELQEECDAVAIPWRLFGNSGKFRFEDLPVTQQFDYSAHPGYCGVVASTYFKTLVKTKSNFQKLGVHRPKNKGKGRALVWYDGSGQLLPTDFANNDKILKLPFQSLPGRLAELNHYSLKSAESFIVKVHRGLAASAKKEVDLAYWVERNFNCVNNTSIQKYRGQVQKTLDGLLELPGLREAHNLAVRLHRERISTLLTDERDVMLLRRIMVAGSSEGFPARFEQEFSRIYSRINQN